MFVKKLVVKGIASGVGMAAEANAERKERKEQKAMGRSPSPNPQARSHSPNPEGRSRSPNPLSTKASRENRYLEKDSSSDSEDDDEVEWQLDEAAAQLDAPPNYDNISNDAVLDPDQIARDFIQQHNISPSPASKEYQPLPCPVIIPQRRPKNKERGFVRAYAPILDECSGIDEKLFIDFLNDLDKASKASPVFDIINLACFAVGFVPNPIAMAVSIAVETANRTAQEMQSRYRRNTFLDDINETLFKPRGLYCMIMTYQPDAAAVVQMDVSSSDQALAKVLSEQDSELKEKLTKLRLSSGKSTGEIAIPEAAPLIYPALENAASQDPNGEKLSALKQSSQFMASYLDRKAQATYAGTNSGSKLAMPEEQRQFKSKYADPNHPIHAGTIWGLVTAGKYDPIAQKRGRKAQRRAMQRGVVLSQEEIKQAELGRKLDPARAGKRKGPLGLVLTPVKKAMKKSILYLTVVNLPSESEMREIKQELERIKSNQSNQSWTSRLTPTPSYDSNRQGRKSGEYLTPTSSYDANRQYSNSGGYLNPTPSYDQSRQDKKSSGYPDVIR